MFRIPSMILLVVLAYLFIHLGYNYVEIGYGLHPVISLPLAMLSCLCAVFVTNTSKEF